MPFFRRKSVTAKANTHAKKENISTQKQIKKRIAIIGSGVSGLTCAHYLVKEHDVTVFEANDYIGGHVNTIEVTLQEGRKSKSRFSKNSQVEKSAIDTGFIVFNERTYPNFFRLLHELQVPFQSTDMSFSVKNVARNFEYNGHTLNTLLSQRKNIVNPKFWRFVQDILQFNKQLKQLRQDFEAARSKGEEVRVFTQQTLSDYLANKRYGKLFTDNYLLPMVSAIWSTSLEEVQDFPLVFFAQFFDNHGLLDVVNRPQWFTIKGGSKQYVNKLVTRFVKKGGLVRVNSPVQSVTRNQTDGKVHLVVNSIDDHNNVSESLCFDEVIFACHADTALKILQDASDDESAVLGHFRFTSNTAVLHTDTSVLPNKPLAWASWNYLLDADGKTDNTGKQSQAKPVLTYHMNILQRLTKQHNYLVTLNHKINPAQIIKSIDYSHPVFDKPMIEAQKQWSTISSSGLHTHFCGAYWFNGFHEDGVRSGLRVCQSLGSHIDIKDEVDASHLPDSEAAHTPFVYKDIPVKADQAARKLKNRQLLSADTNQELVEYLSSLAAKPARSTNGKTKKRGLLTRVLSSNDHK
ncbi:NAD(P)/FAD-dependent oxidoreductase [Psychrobacter sp. 1Y11]|uniref:NAD(P)/FAD-dependent oxidoreductase n=1 Tax=Psychrobacter sp. 1Y11 TaxID=3457446 RepID=UPI003FCFFC3E